MEQFFQKTLGTPGLWTGGTQHPNSYHGKNQCWVVLYFYEEALIPVAKNKL
jgi:hypothetical protein